MSTRYASTFDTPLGTFVAAVDGAGALLAIDFDERGPISTWEDVVHDERRLRPVARALERYFAGELREFELELAPEGTPFQRRVWGELRRIPYGETIAYSELARRLGDPRAVRAVGRANGANPIPIVVPCHRVIGADGTLTGYAGGLERKRALLALEAKHCGRPVQLALSGS
jgi:methylated-DNA-[protein]-cysteine S-methyltransferase